jgi:phosphomannomutase/phosphoglucomutase
MNHQNESQENDFFRRVAADLPTPRSTFESRLDCKESLNSDILTLAKFIYRISGLTVRETKDGARVEFPDGWGLIRVSDTRPALLFRYEAETPKRLAEIRDVVESLVRWIIPLVGPTE